MRSELWRTEQGVTVSPNIGHEVLLRADEVREEFEQSLR
jgi:hypothetical protein